MGKTIGGFVLAALLGLVAVPPALAAQGAAQPPIAKLTGPQDPSQLNATLNQIITSINAILVPLVPATPGITPANYLSMTPSATGTTPTLGISVGGDPNAGIAIKPNGSGNIVLFGAGNTGTGTLQFANTASFLPARGLAGCPAVLPNKPQIGMADHVTGYLIVKDWLGQSHGIPSC